MKQQSYRGGAGNFANDPERAKEAGRAGGKASSFAAVTRFLLAKKRESPFTDSFLCSSPPR
jgi:general stress protein YciG